MSNVGVIRDYLKQVLKTAYTSELSKMASGRNRGRYTFGSFRGDQNIMVILRNWNMYAGYLRATGVPVDLDTFYDVLKSGEFRSSDIQGRLTGDLLKHFIPSATIMRGINPGIIIDDPDIIYGINSDLTADMIINMPTAIYDVLVLLTCIHWTSAPEAHEVMFRGDLVALVRDGEVNYKKEYETGLRWALDVQATLAKFSPELLSMFFSVYDDENNANVIEALFNNFSIQLGVKWKDIESTQGFIAVSDCSDANAFLEDFANSIKFLLDVTQRMLSIIEMPLSIFIAQSIEASEDGDNVVEVASETIQCTFSVPNGTHTIELPNNDSIIPRLGCGCVVKEEPMIKIEIPEATAESTVDEVVLDDIPMENIGPTLITNTDGTYRFIGADGRERQFRRADHGFAERVSVDASGITMTIWRPLDGIYNEEELRDLLFAGIPRRGNDNVTRNNEARWGLADNVRTRVVNALMDNGRTEIRVTRNRTPDNYEDGDYLVNTNELFGPAIERAAARIEAEAHAAEVDAIPFVTIGNGEDPAEEAQEVIRRIRINNAAYVDAGNVAATATATTAEQIIRNAIRELEENPATMEEDYDADDDFIPDEPVERNLGRVFTVEDVNNILATQGAIDFGQDQAPGEVIERVRFEFIDGQFRLVTT